MLALASVAFIGGAFMFAGLMTPIVAAFAALAGVAIMFSWIPLPEQDLFSSNLAIINLIALAIAISLLGPGAFSLDAHMFGRREITIPPNSHVSRS